MGLPPFPNMGFISPATAPLIFTPGGNSGGCAGGGGEVEGAHTIACVEVLVPEELLRGRVRAPTPARGFIIGLGGGGPVSMGKLTD